MIANDPKTTFDRGSQSLAPMLLYIARFVHAENHAGGVRVLHPFNLLAALRERGDQILEGGPVPRLDSLIMKFRDFFATEAHDRRRNAWIDPPQHKLQHTFHELADGRDIILRCRWRLRFFR